MNGIARFGLASSSSSDEEAKKKARLERFGQGTNVDKAEEEKRKARATRLVNVAMIIPWLSCGTLPTNQLSLHLFATLPGLQKHLVDHLGKMSRTTPSRYVLDGFVNNFCLHDFCAELSPPVGRF
jgi:hypothetical protein